MSMSDHRGSSGNASITSNDSWNVGWLMTPSKELPAIFHERPTENSEESKSYRNNIGSIDLDHSSLLDHVDANHQPVWFLLAKENPS